MRQSSEKISRNNSRNCAMCPSTPTGVQDDMLLPITNYLLDLKPAKDGVLHWFCSDADDVGREAALFLLRLFAYKNDLVTAWRTQMLKSLHGCAACIQSLDEAKTAVRSTCVPLVQFHSVAYIVCLQVLWGLPERCDEEVLARL